MMNWIEQITPFWQQWILLSVPGAIVLYLLAEFIAHYGQNLSPRLRYWLFIGVLVKCIIPPLIWVSVPIITAEPVVFSTPDTYQVNESVIQNQTSVMPSSEVPVMEHQTSSIWQPLSWTKWMFIVQLTGTGFILCFLIYKLGSHIRLRQALRDEDTGALCGRLCIRLNMLMPRLYEAPDGMGACAGGFFSPYIVIPKSVLQERYEHQELVIMHELIHVQRMDHIVNWLQVVVFAVFWWHPIIWRMNYLIRCERELCCDERVVQELAIAPVKYSQLLVDAAERQILHNQFQWQSAFANPAHAFQNRIRRIISMNHISKTTRWLSAILMVFLISGITVGFQFVQAQDQKAEQKEVNEQLKSLKWMLESKQEYNPSNPNQKFGTLDEAFKNIFETLQKHTSPHALSSIKASTNTVTASSNLKKVIRDGVRFEDISLREMVSILSYKLDVHFILRDTHHDKIINFIFKGNPVLQDVLDTVLPGLGLAYIEHSNRIITIDEPEKLHKFSTELQIPDGYSAKDITFDELANQITEKTGVQIRLGEGISNKRISIEEFVNPTVGFVLSLAEAQHNLGHAENANGTIYIDTHERVGLYNVGGYYTLSSRVLTEKNSEFLDTIRDPESLKKIITSAFDQSSTIIEIPKWYEEIYQTYDANDEEFLHQRLDRKLGELMLRKESVIQSMTPSDAKNEMEKLEQWKSVPLQNQRDVLLQYVLQSPHAKRYQNQRIISNMDKYPTLMKTRKNIPLRELMSMFERDLNVKFVIPDQYANEWVDYEYRDSATLQQVLDAVLSPLGAAYEEDNQGIIHIKN